MRDEAMLQQDLRGGALPVGRHDAVVGADAPGRILAAVRQLAPNAARRAAEFEAERRIPLDVVEALRSIGVFRMFTPRSRGGLELDLPSGLEVITALSRADGSLGWTAMIGGATGLFLACMTREGFEQAYWDGPDVIAGGSVQPAGTAEAVPGGFRVTGRWPFASGCQHADWLLGLCVMTVGGKPIQGPAGDTGPPLMRAVALPARAWSIEDTWYAAGLKGTGSHHIALEDALVPPANFLDFPDTVACIEGPLYQSLRQILPLLHGAFAVGAAQGALQELIEMANGGRQQLRAAVPMRQSETFQYELGRVAADMRAAEATLQAEAARLWSHALAGTLRDEVRLAEAMRAGAWLATTCSRIADACFTLGGGSAVFENCPLQRRMRDLHTAAQHAMVQQRHFAHAGKMLLQSAAEQ